MTTYGPNDTDSFFHSAMADLNGYDQSLEMEQDEFADALEHQAQHDANMEEFDTQLQDSKAASGAYNEPFAPSTVVRADPMLEGSDKVQRAKQNYMPFTRPGHYDPLAEPEETIKVNKTSAQEKHTAAYHDIFKKLSETSQGQHTSGCSGSRGASTPPATPPLQPTQPSETATKPEPKLEGRVWLGPDDLRDVAKAIVREKRWHDKVAHLHPPIPLASHRYWIGVLNFGQDPRSASKENHFTWMKGNRLTTVETVSKTYTATTMFEGVLMMGGERPEQEDRMEELDLFNDKVVLFRIVEEGTRESVGRRITEGLVTKENVVIELED